MNPDTYEFDIEDITDVVQKRIDAYMKKSCKNAYANTFRLNQGEQWYKENALPYFDAENVHIDDIHQPTEKDTISFWGYRMQMDTDLAIVINKLSEPQKVTIILSECFDVPLHQIAELLHVSERTINTYKRKALEFLRRELKGCEEEQLE